MTRERKVVSELIAAKQEAVEYLDEITRAVADCPPIDPDAVHWGHVGDALRTVEELREIRDRLLGLGEYAG